jgi:hypothetical protein
LALLVGLMTSDGLVARHSIRYQLVSENRSLVLGTMFKTSPASRPPRLIAWVYGGTEAVQLNPSIPDTNRSIEKVRCPYLWVNFMHELFLEKETLERGPYFSGSHAAAIYHSRLHAVGGRKGGCAVREGSSMGGQ